MNKLFGRELPFLHTGESWDISCRPNEMGIVENGEYKGLAFDKLISLNPVALLGRKASKLDKFPLLVKIIDANDDLSVQVHPGGINGKSELWYIMDALPEQTIILGLLDDATPEKLRRNSMDCLRRLPVKKGDIISIPSGTVHALTKGAVVAEIQQNSDTTYRLYDYERPGLDGLPRRLHIEEGLRAVDFERKNHEVTDKYFTVNKIKLNGTLTETSNPDNFTVFTCVEGLFEVSCPLNKFEDVKVQCSRSVFIPAMLGGYMLKGNAVLLKTSVNEC